MSGPPPPAVTCAVAVTAVARSHHEAQKRRMTKANAQTVGRSVTQRTVSGLPAFRDVWPLCRDEKETRRDDKRVTHTHKERTKEQTKERTKERTNERTNS